MYDWNDLKAFLAVAETGSFSAAARRLQRVQSAISQSVQSLEGTLRLTLFDRSGKRPRLTGPGQAVLADARRMVEGARMLRARAESISGASTGRVTMRRGMVTMAGPSASGRTGQKSPSKA